MKAILDELANAIGVRSFADLGGDASAREISDLKAALGHLRRNLENLAAGFTYEVEAIRERARRRQEEEQRRAAEARRREAERRRQEEAARTSRSARRPEEGPRVRFVYPEGFDGFDGWVRDWARRVNGGGGPRTPPPGGAPPRRPGRLSLPEALRVLGLGAGASLEQAKAAFRSLALRWHPDRNPGDASAGEQMRAINEAFSVVEAALR